jgi:serine/threonine protein kinase
VVKREDEEATQLEPRSPVLPRARGASQLPPFKARVEASEGDVIEIEVTDDLPPAGGGRAKRDSVYGLDLSQHKTIGRFQLVKEIARGGMGQVFLARDDKLGRKVAIKVLLRKDAHFVQRFLVEARATARVTHENIVTIYEVGEHDGLPYMVLELLEGETLSALLDTKPSLRKFIEIMVAVARALQRAHADSIVHRDLKPSNIFITRFQQVKVLDFGVARLMDRDDKEFARTTTTKDVDDVPPDATFTGADSLIGTMPYMSPEQWGAAPVDHQSDLWAYGIMFWRALVHTHPAGTMKAAQVRSRLLDLSTPLPSIGDRDPSLPPELIRIVDKCLAKRKADRYQNATELLEDMQLLLESMPLRATTRVPGLPSNGGSFPTLESTPQSTKLPTANTERSGARWALGLALVVAGAGVAAPSVIPAPVAPKPVALEALEAEVGKLATTIDAEIQAGRMRADAVAMTPMLRAAIETDRATLADMARDSDLFETRADEVLEVFQGAGATPITMLRIPATAKALPALSPNEIRIQIDGDKLRALVATPVKSQRGATAGALVLSVPIDLAPLRAQAARHTTSATLQGLDAPLALSTGSPTGQPIELPVPASAHELRVVATIAALPPPSRELATQVRYACFGGAGLFLLGFVAFRRRSPDQATVITCAT